MKRALLLTLLILGFLIFPLYSSDIETYYITYKKGLSPPLSSSFTMNTIIVDEENVSSSDSIKDLLAHIGGVSIVSMGGPMESHMVRLRGSSVEQVVLLVDGKRVNSLQGGKYDISNIPLYNVERIEVIEGALSAIYGENAIGGVINIITKNSFPAGTSITGDLSYGSYNTIKGSLYSESKKLLSPFSSFSSSIGAFAIYSDGTYPYVHNLTNNSLTRINADGYKLGVSSTFSYEIDSEKEESIGGALNLYIDEKGVPGAIEFPSFYATMSDKKIDASFTYAHKNNQLFAIESDFSLSYIYRLYDPNTTSANINRFSSHENGTLSSSISLSRNDEIGLISSLLRLKGSYRYDSLNSTDLQSPSSSSTTEGNSFIRHHVDIALHDTLKINALSLFPSLRVDYRTINSTDGLYYSHSYHPSINLGSSLSFFEDIEVKLNIGSAYREPTFDDMFWSSSAFAVGNPYLKSEKARSVDVGVNYTYRENISIKALYFNQHIEDLIQWIPGVNGKWSPHNIGKVEKWGVGGNITLIATITPLITSSLSLDYQYVNATDMSEGAVYKKKLPFIAPHTIKGAFSVAQLKNWKGEFQLSYISYRFITSENTKFIPHTLILDASFSYSFDQNWSINFILNNITNTEYYDASFYPIPGINGKVSVTYKGGVK
ncbi:MAG: TonB-dependent receptor [Spirochaetia bacterium]|nr:TonB-dependent receptor [Spirochaetia bacterium]